MQWHKKRFTLEEYFYNALQQDYAGGNIMKLTLKNLIFNLLIFVASIVLSFILCFFIFDDIFLFISGSVIGFIVLRIFLAVILYFLAKLIINKKFTNTQLMLLFIAYLVLIVSLTLFKTHDLTVSRGYNFNPLEIFKDVNTRSGIIMSVGNAFAYIPIGLYIRKCINKKSNVFLVFMFVIYCTCIEVIQYIAHLGVADIDDIILNTFGFFCGIKLFTLYKKFFKEDII